jgi:polysaccharide export outer membrane protein
MSPMSRWIATILTFSLSASIAAAQTPAPPAAPPPGAARPDVAEARTVAATGVDPEYRIGPEDVLDIHVWKNADLTRTVPVRPDGHISLPLLNDLMAAGLTPMELRDTIASRLSTFVKDAEVSVIVREIHSFKVSVLGMVKLPGRYEFRSQATIVEALALAGGLTEFAKRDRIALFRNDGKRWQRFGFDYRSVVDENAEQNFVLRPGDIIVVP